MIITCPACATQFRIDGTRISASGTKVRCARCSHVWLQTPDAALPYPGPKAKAPAPPPPAPEPAPPAMAAPRPEPAPPPPRAPEPPPPPAPLPNLTAPAPLMRETPPEPLPVRAPQPAREDKPRQAPPLRPTVPLHAERPERGALPVVLFAALLGVMLLVGGGVYALIHYRAAIVNAVPKAGQLYCAIGIDVPVTGLNLQDIAYSRNFEDGTPILEIKGEIINTGAVAVEVPRIRAALRDKTGKELYHWTFAPPSARLAQGESASFANRLPSPDTQATSLALSFATPCSH